MNIKESLKTYLSNFAENYPNISDCSNRIEMHKSNFEEKLDIRFWEYHMQIMENIGLGTSSKDISILDMGTQFGFIPHFLKEHGFTDVECTNSSTEASEHLYELEIVWKEMGIDPLNLHVHPMEEFVLNKKYDMILATQTNVLWNSNRVVRYHKGHLEHEFWCMDSEGDSHSFFSPYNTEELKFFINNIKKYLTPNGIAVMQPYPFAYGMPAFKKELSIIQEYQPINHPHDLALYDYFVITNDNIDNK